jgi:secondary thiamine-phosphate synthase enzyme
MTAMTIAQATWSQTTLKLPPFSRGFHHITSHVKAALPNLRTVETGLLHLFLLHTSASILIGENADPDVPRDLERSFNSIVPESFPYIHTCEGPDDMPAHIKAALIGCSLQIPVSQGRLVMGTWQGIFLGEHRDHAHGRSLVLTLQGEAIRSAGGH